jgi:hypothetical protein
VNILLQDKDWKKTAIDFIHSIKRVKFTKFVFQMGKFRFQMTITEDRKQHMNTNQNKAVEFEDLGIKEYQPAWDYQEKLMKGIIDTV